MTYNTKDTVVLEALLAHAFNLEAVPMLRAFWLMLTLIHATPAAFAMPAAIPKPTTLKVQGKLDKALKLELGLVEVATKLRDASGWPLADCGGFGFAKDNRRLKELTAMTFMLRSIPVKLDEATRRFTGETPIGRPHGPCGAAVVAADLTFKAIDERIFQSSALSLVYDPAAPAAPAKLEVVCRPREKKANALDCQAKGVKSKKLRVGARPLEIVARYEGPKIEFFEKDYTKAKREASAKLPKVRAKLEASCKKGEKADCRELAKLLESEPEKAVPYFDRACMLGSEDDCQAAGAMLTILDRPKDIERIYKQLCKLNAGKCSGLAYHYMITGREALAKPLIEPRCIKEGSDCDFAAILAWRRRDTKAFKKLFDLACTKDDGNGCHSLGTQLTGLGAYSQAARAHEVLCEAQKKDPEFISWYKGCVDAARNFHWARDDAKAKALREWVCSKDKADCEQISAVGP